MPISKCRLELRTVGPLRRELTMAGPAVVKTRATVGPVAGGAAMKEHCESAKSSRTQDGGLQSVLQRGTTASTRSWVRWDRATRKALLSAFGERYRSAVGARMERVNLAMDDFNQFRAKILGGEPVSTASLAAYAQYRLEARVRWKGRARMWSG